tara:strand:- start:413 stop:814 length:402 start_codon:yes stop_codon:yes gene_type:complete
MNYEALENAIRSKYKAAFSSVQTAHDNAPFDPPDDAIWVRFTILQGNGQQTTLGRDRTFRTSGIIRVSIFDPAKKGTKESAELADQIADEYRSSSVGGVVYQTPVFRRIGISGGYYQSNLDIPFFSDRVVAGV